MVCATLGSSAMDFFAVGFWAICKTLPVLFVTAP
jgi:hypothetical protein